MSVGHPKRTLEDMVRRPSHEKASNVGFRLLGLPIPRLVGWLFPIVDPSLSRPCGARVAAPWRPNMNKVTVRVTTPRFKEGGVATSRIPALFAPKLMKFTTPRLRRWGHQLCSRHRELWEDWRAQANGGALSHPAALSPCSGNCDVRRPPLAGS